MYIRLIDLNTMKQTKSAPLIIGISGKRDIPDRSKVCAEIESKIREILRKEKNNSFIGVSAIAAGADSIFAEVVSDVFHQPLHVVLPFDENDYAKDFDTEKSRAEFNKWLAAANEKSVATPQIPQTHDERNDAYFACGKSIVDQSDYLIVVWDGLKPNGKGGTAEILGYAAKTGKINRTIIVCVPTDRDKINSEIQSLLKDADDKAMLYKKHHQRTWTYSIALGLVAALCFASYTSFELDDPYEMLVVFTELSCLAGVYLMIRRARNHSYHKKLIEYRLRTEKIRLLDRYYHSDNEIKISQITAENDHLLANAAKKSNGSVGTQYNSALYKFYTVYYLITDQIAYHKNKIKKKIGNRPAYFEWGARGAYSAFIVILFLHLGTLFCDYFAFHPLISFEYNHALAAFSLIMLPPSYAAVEAWLHFNEWDKLHEQSTKMIDFLEGKKKELEHNAIDEKQLSDVLEKVSFAMLAENNQWYLVVSNNVTPHVLI